MIWVDSSGSYDAFLSYSWKSDSKLAPAIQSVIQRFLCPWYKLRAKTVFRDLSCLPAGSSLETELYDGLDRSTHLIVLASPAASQSHGMEIEARHWFSRPRNGQILIIVTAGEPGAWERLREHLLPPALRNNLADEALWVPLQNRRDQILENPNSRQTRKELIEDLKEILLRFYPESDWGELRGEESKQRKRALGLLSGIALLFVALALLAVRFEKSAKEQGLIAESCSLAAKAEQTVEQDQPAALDLAIRSWLKAKTPEARLAVAHAFPQPEWLEDHTAEVRHAAFSPDGQRVVTASDDHTAQVWNAALGRLLVKLEGHSGSVVSAVFSPDGQRIVSASEDHTARVWNTAKGELLATLQGHEDGFWAAHPVFSRSGDRIVIADNDGAAWMLNAVKGQLLAKLEGHAAGRVNVEFSPDGHSIVTASPDKTARVYRLLKLSDISALLAK